MALKVKRRKSDPKEVQLLFDIHKLLNHGGKHWIKGFWSKHTDSGMCYCLDGGVRKVTRSYAMRNMLRDLLEKGIRRHHGAWRSLVGFNDTPETEWPDVETVIELGIKEGRGEHA